MPKRRKIVCTFAGILATLSLAVMFTQPLDAETLEDRLAADIQDYRLDDFSRVEAAFILSGVNNSDSLDYYVGWYQQVLQGIREIPFDPADRPGNASKVFNVLHARWLKTYQLEATTLRDIVKHKRFNCVSATILFNLICDDQGWDTEAFETPTHVYTLFNNFTQQVMVENTSPMGFNIINNLQAYSRYLAQYYPQSEVVKIGLDRLYLHEQSQGRRIDNTELLGLLAYNQAYFARKRGEYARAYGLVLLAQNFNSDSRSNIQFELGLYNSWGKQLFDARQYLKAFGVLADGAYRYPDDSTLRQNTRAAFFRASQDLRSKADWPATRQLVNEMLDLQILDENDGKILIEMLQNWQNFLTHTNKTQDAKDAANLIAQINALDR